ncbi:MAG: hypothetical protein ACI9KN_001822 [Gammaproteobacteria bacterium]|jgi:hypothetical protein
MLTDYWYFARAHPRFLGFGFLLAFLSSAGQTYFIGIFGPEIQTEFALDAGSWGRIYMMGTLASAVVINWSGTLIDGFDLRVFTVFSLVGLGLACLLMSSVTTPLFLVLAIFMLRQFGRGLTSHAGVAFVVLLSMLLCASLNACHMRQGLIRSATPRFLLFEHTALLKYVLKI